MKSYKRVAEDNQQLQQFVDEATAAIKELEAKPSGTKLYKHEISFPFGADSFTAIVTSTRSEPYTNQDIVMFDNPVYIDYNDDVYIVTGLNKASNPSMICNSTYIKLRVSASSGPVKLVMQAGTMGAFSGDPLTDTVTAL